MSRSLVQVSKVEIQGDLIYTYKSLNFKSMQSNNVFVQNCVCFEIYTENSINLQLENKLQSICVQPNFHRNLILKIRK